MQIKMVHNEQIFILNSTKQDFIKIHLCSCSCRNVRAEASLSSKCHGAVSCVMDVRPGCPPPPPDGRHETDEGITHHLLITLLQSGNKAAAASAAVSALFHFLCGRKLSQHAADRHRPYQPTISQVLLKGRPTVSHAAPPAHNELSEARWRLNANRWPGDSERKHIRENSRNVSSASCQP